MKRVKFFVRKLIGWILALGFIVTGRRKSALRKFDQSGNVLAISGHDLTRDDFEGVVVWLVEHGFRFLTGDEFLAVRTGKLAWKARKAWISFDDGWKSVKTEILPVLEKFNIPISIFVSPKETERGQIWTMSILNTALYREWRTLAELPSKERYEKVDEILPRIGNPRKLLTRDELIELAKHPLVTLENHTMSHLPCSKHRAEVVRDEIEEAGRVIREWTGRPPKMVAYPYGWGSEELDTMIAGMGLAPVWCKAGISTGNDRVYCRNMIAERMSTMENVCRVLNAWIKVKTR